MTSTGESGACTLKGAIAAAAAQDNNTGCGPVVQGGTTPINLPANTYTPFTSGQITVPAGANIEIIGGSINDPLTTRIDATNNLPRRVFEIKSGATVKMTGITITGGRSSAGLNATSFYYSYSGDDGGGILNQGNLTLDHVVVTGNQTGDGGDGWNGGLGESGGSAGYGGSGGGIYNADYASLTVTDSLISDNSAGDGGVGGNGAIGSGQIPSGSAGGDGGRGGSGGGIYNSNYGSISIDRTTIKRNFSGRGGTGGQGGQGAGGGSFPFTNGGTGGDGGDGGNNGKQYRKDQGLFWDYALGGGGIYNLGALNMTASTVSGNVTGAGGRGGASGAGGQDSAPPGNFRNSGRAGSGGGGGRGGGILSGITTSNATLTNVTITGNLTGDGGEGGGGGGGATSSLGGGRGGYGGDGGALWAQGAHNGQALLTHVTITRNFPGGGGLGGGSARPEFNAGPGARGVGAGIAVGSRYNPYGSGVHMQKTLISANGFSGTPTFDKNCVQAQPIANYQEFYDLGNNLSFPLDNSVCPTQTNVDPDLGLLGDNGGPTETIVPQPGSAVIGGVPLNVCSTVTTDQRGFPRPGADGTSCDIGAVETGAGPSSQPTTTILGSSPNPSTTGQQVTYAATVSPPPSSGTINFKDGGVVIPGCEAKSANGSGQATCSVTYPVIGDHTIVAAYTGNSLFDPSTSNTLSQSVGNGTIPDTTPPDTLIDSGPPANILVNTATFTFHGTPGDTARLQCKMDTEAFAECSSPKTYTGLSDGTHIFNVRAVDAIGNQDASPAVSVFKVGVDTSPAKKADIGRVNITGPDKIKKGTKATFKVKIPNSGDAAATGVKLKVSGGGGQVQKNVGTIAAGKTETEKVTFKLTKTGQNKILAKVTSGNAGGGSDSTSIKVKRR